MTIGININIKRTPKICLVIVNEFWNPFTGRKERKAWNKLEKNVCCKKKDKI